MAVSTRSRGALQEADLTRADLQGQDAHDDRVALVRTLTFVWEGPKRAVMLILIIAFVVVIMVIQSALLSSHRYHLFVLITLMASVSVILLLKTMEPGERAQST